LILLTLRLFAEHEEVLEACRAKYRYVMADEYQDTNATQFQLVHLLTQNIATFASWATTTRASTAGVARRLATC
jgi:superfamily I DNA/RNA helicase